ncbi:MAG TPA: hypothetical protein VG938_12550 [Verrucomicrobiae bacterium]|jgi:hypothetical protein|nr:hypothetical protein [Verrucomicrobiae bacterium]
MDSLVSVGCQQTKMIMALYQIFRQRRVGSRTNRRLALCLVSVLAIWLDPLFADAFWSSVSVKQTNINSTTPFVRIVPLHYGTNSANVNFSVFVLVKNKSDEKIFSGILYLKDSNNKFIALTQVQVEKPPRHFSTIPQSWTDKSIVFEFTVDTNYLEQSEFTLQEADDPIGGAGGITYHFNLKEFDRPQ